MNSKRIIIILSICFLVLGTAIVTSMIKSKQTKAIYQKMENLGGLVELHYHGPQWCKNWINDSSLFSTCNEIDLSGSNVTNQDLIELEKLSFVKQISLEHTEVDDEGLLNLIHVNGLEYIRCRRSCITYEGIQKFMKLRPNVKCYID